jgi:excinuclease UvrABC helicase subunit UvrB
MIAAMRREGTFELRADFEPQGDQPAAIARCARA